MEHPISADLRPILVVGPSGIGKSTVVTAVAARFPQLEFCDLDQIASKLAFQMGIVDRDDRHALRLHISDDQLFLAFGLHSIGVWSANHPDKRVVVDVGAGFQVGRSAEHLHKLYPIISIVASAEVAYQRFLRRSARDRQEFLNSEFNEHRRKVYDSTRYRIDSSRHSSEETVAEFATVLGRIIGNRSDS